MFFYKRSLARAGGEDLRRAAEAVVDAALICNASQGRFPIDPALDAGADVGGETRKRSVRDKLIESILEDPSRTEELFRS